MTDDVVMKTEAALIKKVDGIANVLASAGLGYTDYLTQLTYILFLKMDAEKEELGLQSLIPEGYRWEDVASLNGEDLLRKYEEILKALSQESGIIGTIFTEASNKIKEPAKLKRTFSMVDSENWYMMEGDFKGALYESLLEKYGGQDQKRGAGQYFTPRALIQAIVEVVNPHIGETVADPACGTGGFLLRAYAHMKGQSRDVEKQKFLKNHTFFGADITPLVVTLASMNLYLHDVGTSRSPIVRQDSLTEASDTVYDVILANPPFGKRAEGGDVSSSRPEFVVTSDNQVNFLQHIMSIVKTGGRVGIVLPDSVLTDSGAASKVREKLLNEFNLHTILRLPSGLFYANSTKTNVLFFEKGKPTEDIWVYDYRAGVKHTLKKKPLTRKNLDEFVSCFCSGHLNERVETFSAANPNGRWRRFSRAEILKRANLSLDFKWLNFDEEDERSIPEILSEMEDESKAIVSAVSKLQSLFRNEGT